MNTFLWQINGLERKGLMWDHYRKKKDLKDVTPKCSDLLIPNPDLNKQL